MSMKKYHAVLFLFFLYTSTKAQIPEPAILFMEPIQGESYEDILGRTHQLADGSFITMINTRSQTGYFDGHCTGASFKVLFSKYKADGYTLDWEKCYNTTDSSYFYIYPNASNDVTIAGAISRDTFGIDFLILKDDISGNRIWGSKYYGGSAGDRVRDMIAADDGGYIAIFQTNSNDRDVGSHYGSQFTMDIWVLKVDSNGDKVWSTVLGGSQDEYATCVVPGPNGGCYVLAYTLSNDYDCTTNHGNADVFVARLDSNGNKVWTKCFGGSGDDGARSTGIPSVWGVPDGKGGVLIGTTTYSADGDVTAHLGKADFWLLNVDSNGNITLNKCYGGPDTDEHAQAICRATDGSLWIGGVSFGKSGQVANYYGGYDGWLVHADGAGNFLSAKVFGGPNVDEISLLQPLDGGLILVGGAYRAAGGTVPDTFAGGVTDVFLARMAPWTTHVSEQKTINEELIAHPNPANTVLYLSLKNTARVRNVDIYNVSGKRIYRSNSMPDSIDVKGWPEGIYTVQIKTNGEILSTKIIIQ